MRGLVGGGGKLSSVDYLDIDDMPKSKHFLFISKMVTLNEIRIPIENVETGIRISSTEDRVSPDLETLRRDYF